VQRILGFAKEYRVTWQQAVTQFKEQKKAAAPSNAQAGATAPNPAGTSTFAAVS
jgi:hypothetical protein